MPENEFEKKVSSEMQELKFRPSENVWLRVEERIRKKNKRRVFVIIFLLAGLALLGYWQRTNLFGEKKTDLVSIENQKKDNSDPSTGNNNSSNIKENTETIKQEETGNTKDTAVGDKPIDERVVDDKKDNRVATSDINKQQNNNKKETRIKAPTGKNKGNGNPKASIEIASANSQKPNLPVSDVKTNDAIVAKPNDATTGKKDGITQPSPPPQENRAIRDTLIGDSLKKEKTEQKEKTPEKADTMLKTKAPVVSTQKKDSSRKKWKWGLHLTPGISSLNNSLSLGQAKSADYLSFPNSASGGSASPPARQQPSDVKAGFAFQAGAFVQKQLSTRTGFSLGLQYGYYSHVIGIGNRRDSLLGNSQYLNALDANDDHIYNAGGDTEKFTNRYHFIELPLQFQWQLNKNKTKPFIWSSGITVGQLIASNALMYDTAFNGIYYKNNKLLNKTQFSLSTSFTWTIANGKQTQWSLGPVADLHLNRLVDNPFESKQYLFFAGLRTSILFNKKK